MKRSFYEPPQTKPSQRRKREGSPPAYPRAALVVAIAALVVSCLGNFWQFHSQTKAIEAQTAALTAQTGALKAQTVAVQAQIWQSISQGEAAVNKTRLDYPEIAPYFESGKDLKAIRSPTLRARVTAALDAIDLLAADATM